MRHANESIKLNSSDQVQLLLRLAEQIAKIHCAFTYHVYIVKNEWSKRKEERGSCLMFRLLILY